MASTMRARCASAADIERERAIELNCACSSAPKGSSDCARPTAVSLAPKIPRRDAILCYELTGQDTLDRYFKSTATMQLRNDLYALPQLLSKTIRHRANKHL